MSDEDDKLGERDAALQRYFDGEMPAEERAAFELTLGDEDRQRLAALAEVGAVLQGALEAEAGEVDLWPQLSAKLAAEAAPARQASPAGGQVVPLRRRRPLRTALWAAASGLAAAAAAAFVLYTRTAATSNECDVESLETEGAVATVLQLGETHNAMTVIWTEED